MFETVWIIIIGRVMGVMRIGVEVFSIIIFATSVRVSMILVSVAKWLSSQMKMVTSLIINYPTELT